MLFSMMLVQIAKSFYTVWAFTVICHQPTTFLHTDSNLVQLHPVSADSSFDCCISQMLQTSQVLPTAYLSEKVTKPYCCCSGLFLVKLEPSLREGNDNSTILMFTVLVKADSHSDIEHSFSQPLRLSVWMQS